MSDKHLELPESKTVREVLKKLSEWPGELLDKPEDGVIIITCEKNNDYPNFYAFGIEPERVRKICEALAKYERQ